MRKSDFLDPLRIQTAPEHNLIFHYLKGDLQEAIKYSYPPMKALTNFFFRPENTLIGAGGKGSRTGREEELLSQATSGPHLSGCYSPFCIHRMTFFLTWGECLYGGDTPKHLTPLFAPCVLCIRCYRFSSLGYKISCRDIEEWLCIQTTDTKLHSQRKSKADEGEVRGEEKRDEEDKDGIKRGK